MHWQDLCRQGRGRAGGRRLQADVVNEADLGVPIRVIRPTDGIPNYVYDPNRLTLVLTEDGRIADAAWD